MEATGVYWIPLFKVLDARGFDVYLGNSRVTRQISGRKSDVLDCQWIWQLMSHGFLRGAFGPSDAICSMRSLVRQRANKVRDQAQALNRIQKALSQMNIQLANVISNIAGATGMKILRAIISGRLIAILHPSCHQIYAQPNQSGSRTNIPGTRPTQSSSNSHPAKPRSQRVRQIECRMVRCRCEARCLMGDIHQANLQRSSQCHHSTDQPNAQHHSP